MKKLSPQIFTLQLMKNACIPSELFSLLLKIFNITLLLKIFNIPLILKIFNLSFLFYFLLPQDPCFSKPQLSKSFRPYWFETLFQYEYYYSTENYNHVGKLEHLPSSSSFWTSSRFDIGGRYVFSRRLAASTGLNFVNSQANQATTTRTNGGLQTFKGGVEYKIPTSYADFITEGLIEISLYKPNEAVGLPLYGDGAHALGGNIWMLQKYGFFYWHGSAGLLFRSENLSSLFPYQIGFHWRLESWTLSSTINGSWSFIPDKLGDSGRISYLRRSNVGSMIYRSSNPNSNFLDLEIKNNLTNQFVFSGGIGTSIFGRNSSAGTRYYVAIDIHWEPTQSYNTKAPLKNALPTKSSNFLENESETNDTTPFSL